MSRAEALDPVLAYNIAKRCRERAAVPYRDQASQNKFAWECYAASTTPAAPISGFTPARQVETTGAPKRDLLKGRHGQILQPLRRTPMVELRA